MSNRNGQGRLSDAAEVALKDTDQFGGQYAFQIIALYLDTQSQLRHRTVRTSLMLVGLLFSMILALVVLHDIKF